MAYTRFRSQRIFNPARLIALVIGVAALSTAAGASQLRVVTYNTANDVGDNVSTPRTGMGDVLKAIGDEHIDGFSRPIDVLALQESVYYTGTGANPTAQAYANLLNTVYGTTVYAVASLVNGATDGNLTGNGPQTLVFNTSTLQLVSQAALGTPSRSGIARQVMEYQFHVTGASTNFYLFNDHFKSGSGTTNDNRRGIEGSLLAATADALQAGTPIIYAGDYNTFNNTSDQGYANVVSGTGTRQNHGIDPLNPLNQSQAWNTNTNTFLPMETASPAKSRSFTGQSISGMNYRDDFLLNSPGAQSGSTFSYIAGSYHAFGNTGTHTYQQAINTGNAHTFATQLGYTDTLAAQVLSELTQVADHLPVVADYQVATTAVVPEPSSLALAAFALVVSLGIGLLRGSRSNVPISAT